MRKLLSVAMCVVLSVLLKAEAAQAAETPLANPQFTARVHKEAGGKELKYRLLIPKDYVAGQSRPLVLWLHGANEKGNDNDSQVKNIAGTFLGDARGAAFVLAPQCPQGSSWFAVGNEQPPEMTDIAKMVMATVAELHKEFKFDDRRIYIGGFSMGSGGAWELMIRYPNLFAAGLMISGPSGDREGMPAVIKHIPLWVFHGDKDRIAPVGFVRKTMVELKAAGSNVKYTEYAGGGHDLMTPFKKEADLAEWLFAQKRATAGSFTPGKAPDNAFLIRKAIAVGTKGTWTGQTIIGKDGVPRILIHSVYYIIKASPKADRAAVDFVAKVSKGELSGECEVSGTIEGGKEASIAVEKGVAKQ
jgi:predicted peptidase